MLYGIAGRQLTGFMFLYEMVPGSGSAIPPVLRATRCCSIPAGSDSGGRTRSTQCFAVGPGLILVWLHDLPVPCLSAWQPYSCQNARTCLSGGRNKVR